MAGDRLRGAWGSDDEVLARKGKIGLMRNSLFTNETDYAEMKGGDREGFYNHTCWWR